MRLERFRLPLWHSALSVCECRRSENQAAADTVHSMMGVCHQQDPNREFHATVYSFRALLLSLVNQACIFLKSHFEWSCLPVGFGLEMLFCFQPHYSKPWSTSTTGKHLVPQTAVYQHESESCEVLSVCFTVIRSVSKLIMHSTFLCWQIKHQFLLC